eukprot:TRINITY_DN4758_c0_g1_i4.p1 TRINITY_DN4758_c0_g1~~TRINITY_DN4758_c0_g1_i4.p1  ORF type:complete len:1172 (-),score=258.72 TRINITY_DN4758_c0_g1_i4:158-3673(-)
MWAVGDRRSLSAEAGVAAGSSVSASSTSPLGMHTPVQSLQSLASTRQPSPAGHPPCTTVPVIARQPSPAGLRPCTNAPAATAPVRQPSPAALRPCLRATTPANRQPSPAGLRQEPVAASARPPSPVPCKAASVASGSTASLLGSVSRFPRSHAAAMCLGGNVVAVDPASGSMRPVASGDVCSICGNTFMVDSNFCRRCGAKRPQAQRGTVQLGSSAPSSPQTSSTQQLSKEAVDAWVAGYTAPPLHLGGEADCSITYLGRLAVDVRGKVLTQSATAAPLAPAVLQGIARAIESGALVRVAWLTLQELDKEGRGLLVWSNGDILAFVGSVFQKFSLPLPPEGDVRRLYLAFDSQQKSYLDACECLCLADALARAVVHRHDGLYNPVVTPSTARQCLHAAPPVQAASIDTSQQLEPIASREESSMQDELLHIAVIFQAALLGCPLHQLPEVRQQELCVDIAERLGCDRVDIVRLTPPSADEVDVVVEIHAVGFACETDAVKAALAIQSGWAMDRIAWGQYTLLEKPQHSMKLHTASPWLLEQLALLQAREGGGEDEGYSGVHRATLEIRAFMLRKMQMRLWQTFVFWFHWTRESQQRAATAAAAVAAAAAAASHDQRMHGSISTGQAAAGGLSGPSQPSAQTSSSSTTVPPPADVNPSNVKHKTSTGKEAKAAWLWRMQQLHVDARQALAWRKALWLAWSAWRQAPRDAAALRQFTWRWHKAALHARQRILRRSCSAWQATCRARRRAFSHYCIQRAARRGEAWRDTGSYASNGQSGHLAAAEAIVSPQSMLLKARIVSGWRSAIEQRHLERALETERRHLEDQLREEARRQADKMRRASQAATVASDAMLAATSQQAEKVRERLEAALAHEHLAKAMEVWKSHMRCVRLGKLSHQLELSCKAVLQLQQEKAMFDSQRKSLHAQLDKLTDTLHKELLSKEAMVAELKEAYRRGFSTLRPPTGGSLTSPRPTSSPVSSRPNSGGRGGGLTSVPPVREVDEDHLSPDPLEPVAGAPPRERGRTHSPTPSSATLTPRTLPPDSSILHAEANASSRPSSQGRGRSMASALREVGLLEPMSMPAAGGPGGEPQVLILDADNSERIFDTIDRNHDGVISATEWRTAMTQPLLEAPPDSCASCGNIYCEDSNFCRRCGAPRPFQSGGTEQASEPCPWLAA